MATTSTHSSYSIPNDNGLDRQSFTPNEPVPSNTTSSNNAYIDPAPPPLQPLMQDMQGALLGDGQPSNGIDGEAGKLGGPFVDLIWPGWPPRLPTPGEHSTESQTTQVLIRCSNA